MQERGVTDAGDAPLLPAFYAGRSIFITGGTGFLGKVLIERLLWTCPDVRALHVLLRDKRGQPPHDRLATLKQSRAFDNIRAKCPWQLDKLHVVSGDVSHPRLDLDDAAFAQLQEVSVVFHNAATVKFWESLPTAIHQNVSSIMALMDICNQLPKLEALVHVSTAYSNAEHAHIEERVYAAPARLQHVRALLHALPPALLHDITHRYISPKPNTYVFSKAVAEAEVAARHRAHYAAAIVRPSIVVSAHRNPFPGWVENLSGPSGVVVGCGKGLLRVFNLDPDALADLVPVDVTIDVTLAVAWEIATDKCGEVRVYNCSSQENPVTWGMFRGSLVRAARAQPLDNVLYYPHTMGVNNRYVYKTLELVLQTAPLFVAHCVARACGLHIKPSLLTSSARLRAMSGVLATFATRSWSFRTDNVRRLTARLSAADRRLYNLDITAVNWEQHVFEFVKGARKYLLQEKDDDIPAARTHMLRLRLVHHTVLLVLTVILFRFLMYILSMFSFKTVAL